MLKFEPIEGVLYKRNYIRIFEDIAKGVLPEIPTYRTLILTDLWFILYFVLKMPNANHPFVVNCCREVAEGPDDMTLDIWAREHFKSHIITIAETIQYILKFPERVNGILSFKKEVAVKFLFAIKETFSKEKILFHCFPEVVWENPEKEAPMWSLQEGIVLKRSNNRAVPTVSAHGLVEGMPTGYHFERMIYDDIVTEDITENLEIMEKVKLKFDSSRNLGMDGGTHRVIGTIYNEEDPLMYLMKKTNPEKPEEKMYLTRLKPATDNGLPNGNPVFLSQKRFNELKTTKTFYCQQLLDPSPRGTKKLDKDFWKVVAPYDMPERLFKFLLVDPSGKKGTGDPWAILIVGVDPNRTNRAASRIYILEGVIDKFRLEEAIKVIADMYCNGGKILQIGVEEVGQSTTEVHVVSELKDRGRKGISVENGAIKILKPARRHKIDRIEELAWPLNNGKLHISSAVGAELINKIKTETDGFPFTKEDHALDILSYFILDMLPEYPFPRERDIVPIAEQIPMSAYN